MEKVKKFEKITIEKVDGKRTVSIDGKYMDLLNVTQLTITLTPEPCVGIETVKKEILEW